VEGGSHRNDLHFGDKTFPQFVCPSQPQRCDQNIAYLLYRVKCQILRWSVDGDPQFLHLGKKLGWSKSANNYAACKASAVGGDLLGIGAIERFAPIVCVDLS
jgi:hypothetical protein